MRRGALLLALLLLGSPLARAQTKGDAAVTSLTIFAGTASGLWRSPDWGTNWERVLGRGAGVSLDKLGPVRCIAPLGPQVYVVADSGVFLSFDFGETWKRIADGAQCNAFLTSRYPQADPTLFLATADGLLRSRADLLVKEDTPRSFEPSSLAAGAVFRLEWPGPALIAGTAKGVYLSPDSGDSFVPASEGLPPGEVRALVASGYFAIDPAMFVGVGASGVFRSSDGGRHWLPAGLAGRTVNDLVWIGPILYAATDLGPFRSDDLGKTWSALNAGLGGLAALRLLFPLLPDSGAEVFLATNRGVFWSGDGGVNWRATGDLLQKEEILTLATFPAVQQGQLQKQLQKPRK